MDRKLYIYICTQRNSFKIPKRDKEKMQLISLKSMIEQDAQEFISNTGIKLEILECPNDEICTICCGYKPDIIIADKELNNYFVINFQNLFLTSRQNSKSFNERDFDSVIRKAVRENFMNIKESIPNN